VQVELLRVLPVELLEELVLEAVRALRGARLGVVDRLEEDLGFSRGAGATAKLRAGKERERKVSSRAPSASEGRARTTHNVLLRDTRPKVDALGLVEAVQDGLTDELDASICEPKLIISETASSAAASTRRSENAQRPRVLT